MLAQKYLFAVLGDANEGKTTTVCKAFRKLAGSGVISSVTSVRGPVPLPVSVPLPARVDDFCLTGITGYGLTGFLSSGDQINDTKANLENLVQKGCRVIVCACRKRLPDTFKAVAEISWKYDYTIVWIKFDRPETISKDVYTDQLSDRIFSLFL